MAALLIDNAHGVRLSRAGDELSSRRDAYADADALARVVVQARHIGFAAIAVFDVVAADAALFVAAVTSRQRHSR